ncbi:MAG: 50S ribosomal protein L18 [Candidatus Micrarchaeia archaeon]
MGKATGPTYVVAFRRRRKNLTNYGKRMKLLKSGKTRMVVRRSNRNVIVQFINYSEKGDVTVASASSKELEGMGWQSRCNTPTAYLTGMLAGKKAREKGVGEFVLDIGLATPSKGALVFAAAKGAIDAGVKTKFDDGMVDWSRIRGEHIAKYAESLKGKPEYEKLFSAYLKANFAPEKIPEVFDRVKEQIAKGGR